MLHFDTQKGCYPDEIADVREQVRLEWITAFKKEGQAELDTDPETPAGQLIDSQTAHIVQKDNEVLFLANQFNPLSAEGVFQEALGKIYFLNRHLAESSVANCTVTGLQGTVIPVGARIRSSVDGTTWICAQEVTIPSSGTTNVDFLCEETGPISANAETLESIVTLIPGWDAVTNFAAATVGRDLETQMEFEQRRFDSVAANARGSLAAIYGTLANLNGVLNCVVLENITNVPIVKWGVTIPGHSVWIAIIGGDENEIAEAIYRKKDAGCGTAGNTQVMYTDDTLPGKPQFYYQIERPEPLAILFKIEITANQQMPYNIENLVKKAIIDEFNGVGPHGNVRVGIAQELFASRFYCCVIEAGATTVTKVEIATSDNTNWSDSVIINADKAPTISADDISVSIV